MRKFSPVLCFPLLVLAAQGASFTNGQAARAVIGQDGFTDAYVIPSSTTTPVGGQNVLGAASGIAYANGVLYVADSNLVGATPVNNRVVGFSTTQIPSPLADVSNAVHPSVECWLCGYGAFLVIGQPDFGSTLNGRNSLPSSSGGSMNTPTGVATDGRSLAIADTNNNRVLVWNTIPSNQTTPPSVVLGQTSFTAFGSPQSVTASTMRAPQGVWIQNGKLFVADTQNSRVLIWNSMPTQNGQAADLVLGQPNFGTANQPQPGPASYPATAANQLVNPTSVTSDGTHLFVADFGSNRVLIWNSIPTNMDQGADVVVGQPDMTQSVPNSNTQLCGSTAVIPIVINGISTNQRAPCERTLNFPRFALSDGTRLFIADGGNDRVLIFNQIPTTNGAAADTVLGQQDFVSDIITYQTASVASTVIDNTSSVNTTPAPTSLALDYSDPNHPNLYVSDPSNRRVLVFTPGDVSLPTNSVVNWASEIVRQEAVITFTVTANGSITANDSVSLTINSSTTPYKYTVQKNDTLDSIAQGLVNAVNANGGDANVTAIFSGAGTGSLYLSSKGINLANDSIQYSATVSNAANLSVASSGAPTPGSSSGGYLTAGNAATGAPGMLIEIDGTNLTDQTASINLSTYSGNLPTSLAGVQVFIDGFPSPVIEVSPTQIVSEIPFSVSGTVFTSRNSTSIYVRAQRSDSSITITNATPTYVTPANPGLFDIPQTSARPWPAQGAKHQPGNPQVVVSIDGSVAANDKATISVNGKAYTYTVQSTDTLAGIAAGLVAAINADSSAPVSAAPGYDFSRVVLVAKASGAAGNGIPVTGSSTSSTGAAGSVSVTPYGTSATCCNVVPNSPITAGNPAVAGETIQMAAAGMGALADPGANAAAVAGQPYPGPSNNTTSSTATATMNGVTAQVVGSSLLTGSYGIYTIQMVVPSNLTSSGVVQVYVAQNAFVSNIVTIPVGSPSLPPGAGISTAQVVVSPVNLVFAAHTSSSRLSNSSAQTITVSNPSSATLSFSGFQIVGSNASNFAITSNTCSTSLAPSSSCTVGVTYTPVAGIVSTASLAISDNATGSPQTVNLTGVLASQFEILNQLSGKVLDVTGASYTSGASIQQFSYLGGANQKWSLVSVTGGAYVIMNMQSGKVLDVTGASNADGALIQQYDYLGGANQQWILNAAGSGNYYIMNVQSGKVLDVTGASLANGTLIQQWDNNGSPQQQWQITNLQAYEIQSYGTGGVLDVTNASTASGTPIQQYSYLGGNNQKWYLLPVDNTYYQIVSAASGKVLDVTGASNANGTPIQQYDYFGTANQQWALVPVGANSSGSGVYEIVNRQSGRALDVTGGSAANGTPIQQFDYLGSNNQQWVLTPVSTP